jgi:hypothetical protein
MTPADVAVQVSIVELEYVGVRPDDEVANAAPESVTGLAVNLAPKSAPKVIVCESAPTEAEGEVVTTRASEDVIETFTKYPTSEAANVYVDEVALAISVYVPPEVADRFH